MRNIYLKERKREIYIYRERETTKPQTFNLKMMLTLPDIVGHTLLV